MRHADEFHVGEHDAGAFVPVVQHHVDAGANHSDYRGFGGFADGIAALEAERHDGQFEGGDGLGEDDAAFVVALLDGGADDAGHADAVAAHDQVPGTCRSRPGIWRQGLGVFGAELEDVAHLDAPAQVQAALAVRAGVAHDDIADVGHLGVPAGRGRS
jgi:hypothetical protein